MQSPEKRLDARWFLRLVRHWWWLLLGLPLVFGLATYNLGSQRQRQYVAKATVIVEPAQSSGPLDDYYTILASRGLATTYRELVGTRPVLEPVIGDLKLGYSWEALGRKVSASTIGDSQLLEVSASDADPALAAAIANSVAQHFVQFVVDQTHQVTTPTRSALVQRIADYDEQIAQTQQAIQQLQSGGGNASVQTELTQLGATLDRLQASRADLQTKLDAVEVNDAVAQTRLVVAVPASPPTASSTPGLILVVLFGLVTGALLAGGLATVLEYANGPLTVESDVAALTGAPLLLAVPQPRLRGDRTQPLFVRARPHSAPAQAVLRLAADLKRAINTHGIKSVAITSPEPDGGTALLAANLGVALASLGLATVVVEAEGKGANLECLFGIKPATHPESTSTALPPDWRKANLVDVPNLALLLHRRRKDVPPTMFGSFLGAVARDVDVVLVVAPAAATAGWQRVGAYVDCALLICRALRTRERQTRRAASAIGDLTRLFGIVLWQRGAIGTAPLTPSAEGLPGGNNGHARDDGRIPLDGAWVTAGRAHEPRIGQ
jgi:capsular polysaccharide biosynthesis protein/Mrp family chromosome partitioning ATPase